MSRIRRSFATSRGSFTFSRRRVAQSCNPDTMTEYSGRSIIAPGPQVVINWLWRMTLSFIEAARCPSCGPVMANRPVVAGPADGIVIRRGGPVS